MTTPNQLPTPTQDNEHGSLHMVDPRTGKPVPVGDMRAEFERLSSLVPRDPLAERAFIESKIEMIRTDPNLTEAEKERAINDLRIKQG